MFEFYKVICWNSLKQFQSQKNIDLQMKVLVPTYIFLPSRSATKEMYKLTN